MVSKVSLVNDLFYCVFQNFFFRTHISIMNDGSVKPKECVNKCKTTWLWSEKQWCAFFSTCDKRSIANCSPCDEFVDISCVFMSLHRVIVVHLLRTFLPTLQSLGQSHVCYRHLLPFPDNNIKEDNITDDTNWQPWHLDSVTDACVTHILLCTLRNR